MHSKVGAGIVGGLMAGIVFGLIMQFMTAPTPAGEQVPMLMMVAQVVGSTSIFVGWVYHLFNSALIGAIFGILFDRLTQNYPASLYPSLFSR